jgi:AcrR family transcriptional regulator
MPRRSDARAQALSTAERLVRLQGAAATGLAQIITESGTPKGSFYFHFPGGKEQLLAEMLDAYSARVVATIGWASQASEGDAVSFAAKLCDMIAREMADSDFRLGCALQALADEFSGTGGAIEKATANAMSEWIMAVTKALAGCGVSFERATELALALLAALEGARTIAKATRSEAAFKAIRLCLAYATASTRLER